MSDTSGHTGSHLNMTTIIDDAFTATVVVIGRLRDAPVATPSDLNAVEFAVERYLDLEARIVYPRAAELLFGIDDAVGAGNERHRRILVALDRLTDPPSRPDVVAEPQPDDGAQLWSSADALRQELVVHATASEPFYAMLRDSMTDDEASGLANALEIALVEKETEPGG
jgi:hypothetical protein